MIKYQKRGLFASSRNLRKEYFAGLDIF